MIIYVFLLPNPSVLGTQTDFPFVGVVSEYLNCLDIGCSPGFFSILLAQDGHNVTAVDYSEGMLEQARANFAEAGVEVQTAQGDAQSLPFADGSFDYIVSRNLVLNLEQPAATVVFYIR